MAMPLALEHKNCFGKDSCVFGLGHVNFKILKGRESRQLAVGLELRRNWLETVMWQETGLEWAVE